MDNCIFCKIVSGEISADKVYEDEDVMAFRDVNPAAKVHVLVVPKKHYGSLNELSASEDCAYIMEKIIKAVNKIAVSEKLTGGYRLIANTGEDAGQTVHHLHFHVLGGEKLPVKII